MSNSLHAGKRFRTFNVNDELNRKLLHIGIDTSITSIRIFERLRYERGLPKTLRTDNGPEFLSGKFFAWAESVGMHIQYIQPGKPNQNAYIVYLFRNLTEVREITYWWKLTYNEELPHDALDGLSPSEFLSVNAEKSNFELSA